MELKFLKMRLFRDQNKLRSFEKHLEKQNGEHNLCHVCEHILEGTLAKGVFSTSTSSLSSDSTTSFASTMKLLSNQLSQSALEGLSTKTSVETQGLISSVNTTKKMKDDQKEIEGNGPRSHHIIEKKKKKPRKPKTKVTDTKCEHNGKCSDCYACKRCRKWENFSDKERDTNSLQLQKCDDCLIFHKSYCK